ncbi:MAG: response regulator transcription factor [Candidatus Paceibacterota bacterium]
MNGEGMRILVIDDEDSVRSLVGESLRLSGFTVIEGSNAVEAKAAHGRYNFNAIVCDVTMPGLSGLDFLRWVRSKGDDVPFLFISAKTGKNDVIKAFSEGASDYIRKPFSIEELCYRVLASCSKIDHFKDSAAKTGLKLNSSDRSVSFNGKKVVLSGREYALLIYLLSCDKDVVRRSWILRDVWGITHSTDSRVVNTYVHYLRVKLSSIGWDNIATVRGVGFRITRDG